MDTPKFIAKWSKANLSEQQASQSHFNDLCALIGVKNPIEADPIGDTFTFEKGAKVSGPASLGSKGVSGRADVWYKGRFAWEYKRKGKYKDLAAAYQQLQQYREDLGNPPLMIVCDITNYEIHTNFTGYKPDVYTFTLDELSEPGKLSLLKRVFTDPESFKPTETVAAITEKIAAKIGTIAQALRDRGHDPHDAAHFLMKVMFCLFAEDVELLPKGLFHQVLTKSKDDPNRLKKQMDNLFDAMRTGGDFGVDEISYFNGGLFDNAESIELTTHEIEILISAAAQDWSAIEPSILGTLFERSLDPSKRSQIGAHYTSREDIMLVIEPVIVRPLRKQWEETQALINIQLERRRTVKGKDTKKKADVEIANLLDGFQAKLSSVRVLDPACGSGNFLYVAIQQLLFIEKEVILYASRAEIGAGLLPRVRPTQLLGIEINPYASELAQVSIWIGYLQWMRDNGFNAPRDPILEPIDTIENRDAILAWGDEDGNRLSVWSEGAKCLGQAEWPEADFIVGNPPFLGSKQFRASGIEDSYIECLETQYRMPRTSDLCCYWFSRATDSLEADEKIHVGLLATQGIRDVDRRHVLERICSKGIIFNAWSDLPWLLEGTNVRISIICFHSTFDCQPQLDGKNVNAIFSDLSSGLDFTVANSLHNQNQYAYRGIEKGGDFDPDFDFVCHALESPNSSTAKNIECIRPLCGGQDLARRNRGKWLIDFGVGTSLSDAAQYEIPIQYIEEKVKPVRASNRRETYRNFWWIHNEPRPAMREATLGLRQYFASANTFKHWTVRILKSPCIPDSSCTVFAFEHEAWLGLLQSSLHHLWLLAQGTQLGATPRYTPTTCFETYPFPWSPGSEPAIDDPHRSLHDAIGACAATLNEQRERWLNPSEWVKPIADLIDATDDFGDVAAVSGEEARRLIRQSAIDAACAKDPKLKKRTLTNLYNERPTWLRLAHKALDEAVIAAYAAIDPEGDWSIAWAEVFEESGAGHPLPEGHDLIELREEVEQLILGNLLRMNQDRA
ncbi:MAG: hypothetical protein P1U42_00840 [Phycisphaerales bacterium]|nr:hypothetical protein [Phycisphaerales bacterium]